MLSLLDLIVVRVEVQYLLSQASRQGRRGIGKDLKSRTFLRPLPHHDSACSVTLECCSNSRGLKSTQGLTKCCLVVGNANVKAWHSTFSCKLFTAQHTSNAISSWDGATHPCEMGRERMGHGQEERIETQEDNITCPRPQINSLVEFRTHSGCKAFPESSIQGDQALATVTYPPQQPSSKILCYTGPCGHTQPLPYDVGRGGPHRAETPSVEAHPIKTSQGF